MEKTITPMSTPRKVAMFIALVIIPLAVGALSSFLTSDAMLEFDLMRKPPLAPPGYLFGVVWTILYVLMGIGSFLLYTSSRTTDEARRNRKMAMMIYFIQLFFNFFWSILFFTAEMYYVSFVWLIIMWLMIIALVVVSARIRKAAALCFAPLLIWTTFAAYLNLGIAILN